VAWRFQQSVPAICVVPWLSTGRMEGSTALSQYVVTLQPPEASPLAQILRQSREACRALHGPDEASLYPPHTSVTGFFVATASQAEGLCAAIRALLAHIPAEALRVEVHGAMTTEDGYVILRVAAPGVRRLAELLPALAAPAGIHVRPKGVGHITLAKGRAREQRDRIMELYRDVPVGPCCFDLVVSRLLMRADFAEAGGADARHQFHELLRLALPCPGIAAAMGHVAEPALARSPGPRTPGKRRLAQPGMPQEAQCTPGIKRARSERPPAAARLWQSTVSVAAGSPAKPGRCGTCTEGDAGAAWQLRLRQADGLTLA